MKIIDQKINIIMKTLVNNGNVEHINESYSPKKYISDNRKALKYNFHLSLGLIKLKAYAKLQNTICLLCLPETAKDYEGKNCTVTGYGKPSITALDNVALEGK